MRHPLLSIVVIRRFLIALLVMTGCSGLDSGSDETVRVLFVGNSLTYVNDLPAMVKALASSQGRSLDYETYAFPNVTLQQQWYDGRAREALAEGSWDFVVVQQGPTTLPRDQEDLREWVGWWAEDARDHGTDLGVFMVWPDGDRNAFPAIIRGYTDAAHAADALLLPVGSAWQAAWEHDTDLPLWGPDRFHPSEMGTYLAALVIYGGLTEAALDDLPAVLDLPDGRVRIHETEAQILRAVAAAVLAPDGG